MSVYGGNIESENFLWKRYFKQDVYGNAKDDLSAKNKVKIPVSTTNNATSTVDDKKNCKNYK